MSNERERCMNIKMLKPIEKHKVKSPKKIHSQGHNNLHEIDPWIFLWFYCFQLLASLGFSPLKVTFPSLSIYIYIGNRTDRDGLGRVNNGLGLNWPNFLGLKIGLKILVA